MRSLRRRDLSGSASYMAQEECRDREDRKGGPRERTARTAACSARPALGSLLPRRVAPGFDSGPLLRVADEIPRRKYQSRVRNLEPISSDRAPVLPQMLRSYIHVCEES